MYMTIFFLLEMFFSYFFSLILTVTFNIIFFFSFQYMISINQTVILDIDLSKFSFYPNQ